MATDLDLYVTEMLLKEAKEREIKYGKEGIKAYFSDEEQEGPRHRTNKRFLNSIIRNVDGHNQALLRQEAQELKKKDRTIGPAGSGSRLFALAKSNLSSTKATSSKKASSTAPLEEHRHYSSGEESDGKSKKRRRRENRDRSLSRDRESEDEYLKYMREREERRHERREKDSDSQRKESKRSRKSRDCSSEEEYRRRRRRRRHDSVEEEEDRRSSHHRHRSQDRTREREREDNARKRRKRRRSSDSEDDHHERETSTRSSEPKRQELKSNGRQTSSESKPINIKPGIPRVLPPSRSPTPPTNNPVDEPLANSSQPSKMDKYFEKSYDPRLDVSVQDLTDPVTGYIAEGNFDQWSQMMDILKLRKAEKGFREREREEAAVRAKEAAKEEKRKRKEARARKKAGLPPLEEDTKLANASTALTSGLLSVDGYVKDKTKAEWNKRPDLSF